MSEKKRPDIHKTDLGERQSVRTTFRFSEEALEALNWLSERYGVTMKDVLHSALDSLFLDEDIEVDLGDGKVMEGGLSPLTVGANLSKTENGKEIKRAQEKTVRRTLVVSRKTLNHLNKLSKKYNRSRDYIINIAIMDSKCRIEYDDEKKIEIYKEAHEVITPLINIANDTEDELRDLLGEDDPINENLSLAVTMLMNVHTEIEEEIKKKRKKLS